MLEKKIIPVVFATDNNYVPYCGVAIFSLIQNASKENSYEIYVLYDKLSKMNILRLENLSTDYAKVKCICVHENIEQLHVFEHNHLTIAATYRLVISDILGKYEKIVYLDSDIIVNDDVAVLYDMDIEDNILGAIAGYWEADGDFLYKHVTQTLRVAIEHFFNSGILVINTKKFKKHEVKEKCFELLSQRTDLYFMDQCALNIVCEGKVQMLPARWNYEWLFLFESEIKETKIIEHPAIIHYNGTMKPWDNPGMLLSEHFWKYARQSVFYEEILRLAQMKVTQSVFEVLGGTGRFKNIAVYGAGSIGKKYVEQLLALPICNIVTWVDRNYENIKQPLFPVEKIERLYETEYDHVIIALGSESVAKEVAQMLISNGIAENKIVYIK